MAYSTSAMGSARIDTFFDLIKERRSYYDLSKDLTISKDRFQEIVMTLLEWVPSPFNTQSTRVAVLFDDHHLKFWDMIIEILKSTLSPEMWAWLAPKMAKFRGASTTVLFFEDQQVLRAMEEKYAMMANKMSNFVTRTDAMVQFSLWTALEAEGLGCNLQHFDINDKIAAHFNFPPHWSLNAQLVVGGRDHGEELPTKECMPMEERYRVFGA